MVEYPKNLAAAMFAQTFSKLLNFTLPKAKPKKNYQPKVKFIEETELTSMHTSVPFTPKFKKGEPKPPQKRKTFQVPMRRMVRVDNAKYFPHAGDKEKARYANYPEGPMDKASRARQEA